MKKDIEDVLKTETQELLDINIDPAFIQNDVFFKGQLDLTEEKARKEHITANLLQLKEDQLQNKLIDKEYIQSEWESVVKQLSSQLNLIPAKLSSLWQGTNEEKSKMKTFIKEEIDVILIDFLDNIDTTGNDTRTVQDMEREGWKNREKHRREVGRHQRAV